MNLSQALQSSFWSDFRGISENKVKCKIRSGKEDLKKFKMEVAMKKNICQKL